MSQPSLLLSPFQLGPSTLRNRMVMAPMTRSRAVAGSVASTLAIEYYSQRASAGLIVTEGTQVSPRGVGYLGTPGIYSEAQTAGWKKITDAVHERGGKIFAQLWHVGRISHPAFQPNGELPVAPSAITPAGHARTASGRSCTASRGRFSWPRFRKWLPSSRPARAAPWRPGSTASRSMARTAT